MRSWLGRDLHGLSREFFDQLEGDVRLMLDIVEVFHQLLLLDFFTLSIFGIFGRLGELLLELE